METNITIRLDFHERSFLVMVADRGGQVQFDWNRVGRDGPDGRPRMDLADILATRNQVRRRVDALIGKGTLTETPIVGTSASAWIRLTDVGRNLVDRIKQGTPNDPNLPRP